MPRCRESRLAIRLAAACLLILAGAGCGGKKTVGPGDKFRDPYLSPTSPQNVLENLVTAYNNRDSIQTRAVYDSFYVGTSTNPSAPEPIPSFSRADEIHHVHRLHDDTNIVSVSLDLGQRSAWQRLPADASDPPDWAVIPIQYALVRIEDVSNSTTYEANRSVMEFRFKPRVTAPGDTTWTVVGWDERLP